MMILAPGNLPIGPTVIAVGILLAPISVSGWVDVTPISRLIAKLNGMERFFLTVFAAVGPDFLPIGASTCWVPNFAWGKSPATVRNQSRSPRMLRLRLSDRSDTSDGPDTAL